VENLLDSLEKLHCFLEDDVKNSEVACDLRLEFLVRRGKLGENESGSGRPFYTW
jgi:hypothetical protein